MKIKQIIELRNIEKEIIDLDIKNRILLITFSDYIKQQMIALRIFGIEKNIHVITDDDRIITLVNMISCTTDDEKLISYIKFDHIFIGINIENEKIDDINKYIVTFDNKNITKENKHFEYNSYQITLGKNFVEITDELQKRDSDEYLSAFLEIYELICLFVGYFPLIKKIEIYIDNNVIEEYGDLVYLYYSSNDIMHNSFSLVDINDINNFDKIMEIWKNLKEEVGEYPILGLFISQMKSNHYLEYILVTLLQSIDGYGSVKIRNKLSGKSEKDKRIIEFLIKSINSYAEISKKDKEKVCKYINNYNNPCFEDTLRYLIDNNNFSKKIFFEEIYLNKLYKNEDKNECGLYIEKNSYLIKSVNERNKVSHMSIKTNTFNNLQSKIAYYKWLLTYRVILIQELGININDERFKSCLNKIRRMNKRINYEICDRCKYKAKCILDYNN